MENIKRVMFDDMLRHSLPTQVCCSVCGANSVSCNCAYERYDPTPEQKAVFLTNHMDDSLKRTLFDKRNKKACFAAVGPL